MSELIEMYRDGKTAQVHPEEVKSFQLNGWASSEDDSKPEDPVIAEDLANQLVDDVPESKPTVSEMSAALNRKVTGVEITEAWEAYLASRD